MFIIKKLVHFDYFVLLKIPFLDGKNLHELKPMSNNIMGMYLLTICNYRFLEVYTEMSDT